MTTEEILLEVENLKMHVKELLEENVQLKKKNVELKEELEDMPNCDDCERVDPDSIGERDEP